MASANLVGKRRQGESAPALLGGRYELAEVVGRGADGEVFAAADRARGDRCAVKIIAERVGAAESRLRVEFARLSQLDHPGVVRVRDLGRVSAGEGYTPHAGRCFLVTDLVVGEPLSSVAAIADGAARARVLARAGRELADALAYLHGRGVVHGDVTPANVCLDESGRAVLIDFGLAGATLPGTAAGTLGFAAPEALVGERTPAADLFALGASLFAAWAGTAPYGTGLPAVQRMIAGPAPALSSVRPGLPAPWEAIITRLLAASPQDRFPSARELQRAIGRAEEGDRTDLEADLATAVPAGDPLAGLMLGRERERATLRSLVDRVAERAATAVVVALRGPPGSGRRTLMEAVARDVRIAVAAGAMADVEIFAGGPGAVAALVGLPVEAAAPAGDDDTRTRREEARTAGLADALEARAAVRPLCLFLDASAASLSLARACAGGAHPGSLLLVVASDEPIARAGAVEIVLTPLGALDVAEICRRAHDAGEPPPRAVASVVSASGGHAGTAVLLARALADAGRGAAAQAFEAGEAAAAGFDALLDGRFGALPPAAQRLVALLATTAPQPAALAGAAAAVAGGWLRVEAGALCLASEPHAAAARRGLSRPALADVAREALARLEPGDPLRGDVLLALGERDAAVAALREAARRGRAEGDAGAGDHLARAAALAPEALDGGERMALATFLGERGRYDEAAAALDGADVDASTRVRALVAERRAWLLARRGDTAGAHDVLRGAVAALAGSGGDGDSDLAMRLRGRLARLLVSQGRLDEAIRVAGPVCGNEGPEAAQALEAVVLAHAYAGRTREAGALLPRLAAAAAPAGRIASLEGLVAQLDGRLRDAAEAYQRATESFATSRDVHNLANASLNLGSVLAAEGRYADALPSLARAVRDLGRLGAVAELGTALFDAGLLFVQIGDLDAARRAAGRARAEARARGAALVGAYAAYLEGDLFRREGRPAEAVPLYSEAAAGLERAGNAAAARAARLERAECLAEAGRAADAAAALEPLGSLDDEAGVLGRARVGVHAPALDPAAALALAARLGTIAEAAAAAQRRPAAWRAALLAARLFHRGGDAVAARTALDAARRHFEEVRMATPPVHRSGLEGDPEARWLFGAGEAPGADGARAARAEARLRRLLRINKRLNSEQRLSHLLELIVDTVIELTDAERGFLLLDDDKGELSVKVARNIDQGTLEAADFELSRSIARQAAQGGEPIVTVDASGDDRFREAMSVSDLRLRSVLAVPLVVKGRAVGTIYVDNRLRRGAFGEEDVALVLDFAEQAAIAVENARLLAEVRRRERQIEALNRRLEVELAARREEIGGMRQELRQSREALALRYDYRNIVGRSPRMLELFRLLDRVTDTALPVVIQGESGTGKELVARAVHFNGPRRERPFVSENCAAIPETLLESTLFGYVRGAFTGADHDAKGLFEVADGGTLFLDEVGEMSPAMQGKLLRVLQDGEFRRVGSERSRKVDVRVLAATNRDLLRMVEEGKFRQDLYFRLAVVRIFLPPLRERREDIPPIVEHLLLRHAERTGTPLKTVESAAMARLAAHRWAGNVRELENEIQRAAAMGGARLTLDDLSPAVASTGDDASGDIADPDSLSMKPRVERLERTLIREALARLGGNQTKAAVALGLSRFGLQKKLRRYRLAT